MIPGSRPLTEEPLISEFERMIFMLIKAKTLTGYKLLSLEGEIGKVKEFYFDDLSWKVRYLLADTGNWLPGRKVLISPESLVDVRKKAQDIAVKLTKKQIEESPPLDSDKPVSRQFEESFYEHFRWPIYWEDPYLAESQPYLLGSAEHLPVPSANVGGKPLDPHLLSTHTITGYAVHALDGEIGCVDDFIIDDLKWAIRYLVINTQIHKQGEKVIISPKWIDRFSWDGVTAYVNLSSEAVKSSPKYVDDETITRDYENGLHRHYNRKGYWED